MHTPKGVSKQTVPKMDQKLIKKKCNDTLWYPGMHMDIAIQEHSGNKSESRKVILDIHWHWSGYRVPMA